MTRGHPEIGVLAQAGNTDERRRRERQHDSSGSRLTACTAQGIQKSCTVRCARAAVSLKKGSSNHDGLRCRQSCTQLQPYGCGRTLGPVVWRTSDGWTRSSLQRRTRLVERPRIRDGRAIAGSGLGCYHLHGNAGRIRHGALVRAAKTSYKQRFWTYRSALPRLIATCGAAQRDNDRLVLWALCYRRR
jgi:hypothetical protein